MTKPNVARRGAWLTLIAASIGATACTGSSEQAERDLAREVVEDSSRARAIVEEARATFPLLGSVDEEVAWLRTADGLVPDLERDASRQVDIMLPSTLVDPFLVRDRGSLVSMEVRLEGTSNVAPEVADGLVLYPGALDGHDVIYRAGASGLEDFVVFDSRPTEEHLRYVVDLGAAVAGVRSLENVLELLDEAGVPRLRVAAPYVVDAEGKVHWAKLSVSGCAVDRSPAPPWERRPLGSASRSCEVTVSWGGQDLAYPILVDPSWTPTGNMSTGRHSHTAALLPAGTILVAGGTGPGGVALSSAEIYNPATGTWAVTDSMDDSRSAHAGGVIVSGASTYVLAAGGGGSCGVPCNEAERYVVATSTWQPTGNMNVARMAHTYTTMPLATEKGLVTGGLTAGGAVVNTAETYDPATNAWTSTPGAIV